MWNAGIDIYHRERFARLGIKAEEINVGTECANIKIRCRREASNNNNNRMTETVEEVKMGACPDNLSGDRNVVYIDFGAVTCQKGHADKNLNTDSQEIVVVDRRHKVNSAWDLRYCSLTKLFIKYLLKSNLTD